MLEVINFFNGWDQPFDAMATRAGCSDISLEQFMFKVRTPIETSRFLRCRHRKDIAAPMFIFTRLCEYENLGTGIFSCGQPHRNLAVSNGAN